VQAGEIKAPEKAAITIVDTTPAFWSFWEAAQGKSEEERVRLFMESVVNTHPELYAEDVINSVALTGAGANKDPGKVVTNYLHEVIPFIPRMKSISDTIQHDFESYAADFTLTFPRYAPAAPVYFMVSIFSFDGGTRNIGGKSALLFGIDGIARFHQPDDNLKVFFDHELFHLYHDQIAPELADDDAPLWMSMWEEGLATYVSRKMNDGSTEAQALMSPTLARQTKAVLPKAAKELLVNMDSLDKKEYAAFFYGTNGRADLPPRCGYYVGYLVAQRLGAKRSLQQMADLRGGELKEAVRRALEQLAAQP
jgi:hypothetical protein